MPSNTPPGGKAYSGSLLRRYTFYVPGDPGTADPARHRVDEGHRVDTSGRDEAPRGGGWMGNDYLAVQPTLPGGSPPEFARTHQRRGDHRTDTGGGETDGRGVFARLAYRMGFFPDKPRGPNDLDNAGAAGAAHNGIRDRGMDPSQTMATRRTVDGRHPAATLRLGETYVVPIERVRRGLHFNKPRIRRVLAPSITRETGSPSPGGYSSQYNPAASAWAAGPSNPDFRRLIKAYGQAEYEEVAQGPEVQRANGSAPIGNGGW